MNCSLENGLEPISSNVSVSIQKVISTTGVIALYQRYISGSVCI